MKCVSQLRHKGLNGPTQDRTGVTGVRILYDTATLWNQINHLVVAKISRVGLEPTTKGVTLRENFLYIPLNYHCSIARRLGVVQGLFVGIGDTTPNYYCRSLFRRPLNAVRSAWRHAGLLLALVGF